MDQKLTMLSKVPLFAGLGSADLTEIGRLADEVVRPAGKVLAKEGGAGPRVLRDPRRRRSTITKGDKTIRAWVRVNSSVSSRCSANVPRTATVTASTPARLLVIGHREFTSLLDANRRSARRCCRRSPAGSRRLPAPDRGLRELARSAQARSGRDRAGLAEGRRDPDRHGRRAQRVAHVGIRPRLGEDESADRPVLEHEWAAAVAAIDLGAQLEDVAVHAGLAVDVTAGRAVRPGDGRGHDAQGATAREAEGCAEGAAVGVPVGEPERSGAELRRP